MSFWEYYEHYVIMYNMFENTHTINTSMTYKLWLLHAFPVPKTFPEPLWSRGSLQDGPLSLVVNESCGESVNGRK